MATNAGAAGRSLLGRETVVPPVDYKKRSRTYGAGVCAAVLVFAGLQQTLRAPLAEARLTADAFAMTLRVSECEALQCVARVTTKETFSGASFVLAYWPVDDETAVAYTEVLSLKQTNAVRLYRLRPAKSYRVVARVKIASGVDASTPIASTFDVPTTGVVKFDAGTIGEVSGDPEFDLLLFPWMDAISSFRGLVAMDSSGQAVWYQNLTEYVPESHIEGFSQFSDGMRYCVNDQGLGEVLVVSSENAVEHVLRQSDLKALSDRFAKDAVLFKWAFMGHECRATDDDRVITTGYVYQEVDAVHDVDGSSIKWVAEEFVLLWNPEKSSGEDDDADDRTADIEHVLWLSDYVSLEEVLAARNVSTKDVILEVSDDLDANSTRSPSDARGADVAGAGVMYLHVSSASISPDGLTYVIAMRNINTVIAVHRETKELVWVFSSTLARNDFAMADDARFFNPHDAIVTVVNGRESLCLSDEGYFRTGCEEETAHNDYFCYSRGVCYDLDFDAGAASIVYSFSYPKDGGVTTAEARHEDLFNLNGGNVVHVPGTDRMLTAFTSVYKDQFDKHSYAFETNSTGGLRASVLLPHIASWTATSGGTSGLYRTLPIRGVGGERSTVSAEWTVDPSSEETGGVLSADLSSKASADASLLLYKRTSLSSDPEAECSWLRRVMMFEDAFTHNFTLSDPQQGESDLCAQRCSANPEFFSMHELQTWKAIEGDITSDEWIASWNAAHGPLGIADREWDEWMAMSMTFWVGTLGPFVENFDKLGVAYEARYYVKKKDNFGDTIYVIFIANPYTGAIYELHSDVADAPTVDFSELEASSCPAAIELPQSVAILTGWLDRAERERTNMGGHPTMVVRVSHPATDASAFAAFFDALGLSEELDAKTVYGESCEVAVAHFPTSLASVVPGAWARVQFVQNSAAARSAKSVAMYETYVQELHGKVMGEDFGWDRYIDSHLGIKVEGAYLDRLKPYLDAGSIPYEPHKETDHYDDDNVGSVWTAGLSGLAMEFEGHFDGLDFENVTAFKFCRPSR